MSFLNPVNEPVLRFSSTDASAPQINHNARVAGDVKTVLKACLVTGYGATASAGWSVVNEVDHVAEFVSPSAAMSDYRLGIDDASAASTTWYYQYLGARTTPNNNTISKALRYVSAVNANNGWSLLVTERGILFVEIIQNSTVNGTTARLTYIGAIKTALKDTVGQNMAFWSVGHEAPAKSVVDWIGSATNSYSYYRIATYTSALFASAVKNLLVASDAGSQSAVELTAPLYLSSASGCLLGEQPAILLTSNSNNEFYRVQDITYQGRPALYVCIGYASDIKTSVDYNSKSAVIMLDYWEY